jgi:CRISPR/Cas system CSM-associated protein Csm2 small subunit
MLDILKIDKNGKDIVQYKEEIHSKIEKVYEEVRYYGDLIRQKRESENRKEIINILLRWKIWYGYMHQRKKRNYQRNS